MPPKKTSVAASKASTNTPRPRGRPPNKKVIKSAQFIDDEAEESLDDSDDDMKSVKSVPQSFSKANTNVSHIRGRTTSKKAIGSDVETEIADSDDDMRSVKSTTSSRSRTITSRANSTAPNDIANLKSRPAPRAINKSKSYKNLKDEDLVELSSDDDAMSVKSTKSTKSAMSVNDDDTEWVTTPPRRSQSQVPKTPSASRSSSVQKKRSSSLMVSPITDEESVDMLPSPTKSVRFQKAAPLKGVLKKPEVVVSVSSKSIQGWSDDEIYPMSTSLRSTSKNTPKPSWDDDIDLGSAFEDDLGDVTPKKLSTKTLTSAKGKLIQKSSDDDVFLEDLEKSDRSPPSKDEANAGNRDPLLEDTYKNLPNLRRAVMKSWSSAPALLPSYTELLEDIPNINKKFLRQAVLFSGVGGVRNLARTDPAKLSTGFGSQTYIHSVGGSGPITFVSTVKVRECYLIDPKVHNNKIQKLIEGAGIDGEWERLVCAVGQIIKLQEYKSQVQAGYLQFSTTFATGTSDSPSPSKGGRRVSGPNLFTRGPSASNATLSCHDIIPIYDARKMDEPFYDVVLNLDKLNRIHRELPPDSWAVVGYTVNTWGSLPTNVSFNIKWAMLLGVPGR